MPQNRTIEQWLDSISNPAETTLNSRSKSEFKKSVYRSLKRKSTGKLRLIDFQGQSKFTLNEFRLAMWGIKLKKDI